jgi:molybdopterin converting factor small subunit
MAHVHIPASLRTLTGGAADIVVEAATLRELIDLLERQHPGIAARLVDGDRLRQGLSVAIDSRISTPSLSDRLAPTSEIVFLRSVAGG